MVRTPALSLTVTVAAVAREVSHITVTERGDAF
jgi:hypothetical protein